MSDQEYLTMREALELQRQIDARLQQEVNAMFADGEHHPCMTIDDMRLEHRDCNPAECGTRYLLDYIELLERAQGQGDV